SGPPSTSREGRSVKTGRRVEERNAPDGNRLGAGGRMSCDFSRAGRFRATAAQEVAPLLTAVGGRGGRGEKVAKDGQKARRLRVMREVAGVLERLEATSRHRGVGEERVVIGDDRVVRTPHEQRRH